MEKEKIDFQLFVKILLEFFNNYCRMRTHFFQEILNFFIILLTPKMLQTERKNISLKDTADSRNKLFSFGQQTKSIWEKKIYFYY